MSFRGRDRRSSRAGRGGSARRSPSGSPTSGAARVGDRLHAERPGSRGDRRGAARQGRRAGARPRQRLVRARRARGRRARAAARARPQRGDRRHPARARDRGQALGLDASRERARAALARPRSRAADAERRARSSPSRASARRGCSRTTCSSAPRRRRWSRSSATSPSSSRRGESASTPSREASSTPEALDHFPNREQMLEMGQEADAGRPPRRARGHRRRGRVPLLARGGDGLRPRARRRRRLLAAGLRVEPTEQNRKAWDEIHRRRTAAMAGQLGIPEQIRELLPDIEGKHVLHLQCATGESTAELVELGALVTRGRHLRPRRSRSRASARPTSPTSTPTCTSFRSRLRRGRFDLVYTGGGVLIWLQDLDSWATGIAVRAQARRHAPPLRRASGRRSVDPLGHWRDDYFDDAPLVTSGWTHFTLPGDRRPRRSTSGTGGSARSSTRSTGAGLASPASSSSRRSTSGSSATAGFPGSSRCSRRSGYDRAQRRDASSSMRSPRRR